MSNKQLDIIDKLYINAYINSTPLNGSFELTPRCNLNCKMCYIRKNINDKSIIDEEMSAEEWIELAKQARDQGMLFALLTGGEIFARKDFKQIYEGFSGLGIFTTLYTNGTLIDFNIANWLAQFPPQKVSITFYGASAEMYRKITGQSEGYEKAKYAVKLLQERHIPVEIKAILLQDNVQDIIDIFEFAYERNILFRLVNYVFPAREENDADPEKVRFGAELAAEKESEIFNYIKIRVNREEKLSMDEVAVVDDATDDVNYKDPNYAFECQAGRTSFWINWKGKMTYCGLVANSENSVKNNNFLCAWNILKKAASKVEINSICKECDLKKYCLTCPARTDNEKHDENGVPKYMCENAEARKRIILNNLHN